MNGNSTFLIGVNDEDVDRIIDLIGTYSKKRVQPAPVDLGYNTAAMGVFPAEVTVGGATIFVMDVERSQKV